jgi:rRNA-processing protein FCF1
MDSILVDTSSILFGLSRKVDVFMAVREQLGLSPRISFGVIRELSMLSTKKGPKQKYAKVGLSLIDRHGVDVDEDDTYVDKWILKNSKKYSKVCTNDTKLRKELTRRGATTYSISGDGTLR